MSIDNLINSIKQTAILHPEFVTKIAVLYSHEQKCFHIESLIRYVTENFVLSVSGKQGDYRLLGITNNEEETHELIEEIKSYFTFLNFKY